MTQRSSAGEAHLDQPLRVLMAVGAASAVGGLEASFARIVADLSRTGVTSSALVVGSASAVRPSLDFLERHLPTRAAAGWRELWQALAGYDVVHVHGATSALWPARIVALARLRRIPLVVTLHLPSHPPRQPRLRGELRSRLRMIGRGLLLFGCGAHVYAPSAAAARVARRQLRPWPVRVAGLWNGVLDPGFSPVPADGPLRLVFVGRLSDHKRPLDFVAAVVAAAADGADVRADIVGEGSLRAEVERSIAVSNCQDRFTLHGQLDDAAPVIEAADLLVLTSMTEGCPLVAMEAAAAGRSLLARSGIEGLAEGWGAAYISVGNEAGPAAFAAELVSLAADRDSVVRLGAMARQRYEAGFSAERAAQSLRAAYDLARS